MAVKIAVAREYEDEKRHVHSNRLLLFLLQKKVNCFKWYIFLTFEGYAPDWLKYQHLIYHAHTLLAF